MSGNKTDSSIKRIQEKNGGNVKKKRLGKSDKRKCVSVCKGNPFAPLQNDEVPTTRKEDNSCVYFKG